MEALWRGIGMGFMIAVPVGPIGLLCIRRTLAHGWRAGFASGLGAATADTLYGFLAAAGLTFLTTLQRPAAMLGGFLLLYMAWQTATSIPTHQATVRHSNMYLSTLALTITNPMTIIVFLGMFAGLSGVNTLDTTSAILLVLGVGLGSTIWWLMLSHITARLGRDISPNGMRWINRISGILIGAFGVAAIWSAIV
ncbi:MAG: LysE family translocator [Chloroflexota bacterium]|jgi:threonine/homoserine/homoserine lactone efflux protein